MARRTTNLALVALAVLVAAGPSAMAFAAAAPAAATSGPPGATAVGPIDEPVDANTTDGNRSDGPDDGTADETLANATNATDDGTNTTDEPIDAVENDTLDETDDAIAGTNGTLDETTETLNETNDTLDETADATTPVIDETANATEDAVDDATNRTTEAADSVAPTELEAAVADAANATERAAGVADAVVDATEVLDGATNVSLDAAASSPGAIPAGDARRDDEAADAGRDDRTARDETSESSARAEPDRADGRDDLTATETAAATGTGDAGADGARADDAEAAASGTDSDWPPDGDHPVAPSGTEAAVGVGALTAVALLPHLADGFVVTGDAGALSAASSAAANSRPSAGVRGSLDKVWRFATAFRYSRYDDSDPLDHDARARLHDTVEASPGAYLSELCDRADVAVSTARYHLDVLEDEGLVTTAKVRGKRRYFPAHSDDVELAAALADEEAAEVLRALARLGDAHGGRLADELDRDPSTVSHHLSRLEDAGLVERERAGRAVVNRLAPEVERAFGGDEVEGDEDGDAGGETPAIAD